MDKNPTRRNVLHSPDQAIGEEGEYTSCRMDASDPDKRELSRLVPFFNFKCFPTHRERKIQ